MIGSGEPHYPEVALIDGAPTASCSCGELSEVQSTLAAAERAARAHWQRYDPEDPFYGVVATRRRVARLHSTDAMRHAIDGHSQSCVDYMALTVQRLSLLSITDLAFNQEARELLSWIAGEEHWS